MQVLHALFDQRADEVLGNAAQPEASEHDGVAILDVVNGLVCICHYLVHCHDEFPGAAPESAQPAVESTGLFRRERRLTLTTNGQLSNMHRHSHYGNDFSDWLNSP